MYIDARMKVGALFAFTLIFELCIQLLTSNIHIRSKHLKWASLNIATGISRTPFLPLTRKITVVESSALRPTVGIHAQIQKKPVSQALIQSAPERCAFARRRARSHRTENPIKLRVNFGTGTTRTTRSTLAPPLRSERKHKPAWF